VFIIVFPALRKFLVYVLAAEERRESWETSWAAWAFWNTYSLSSMTLAVERSAYALGSITPSSLPDVNIEVA
jgi:hypothetical protein